MISGLSVFTYQNFFNVKVSLSTTYLKCNSVRQKQYNRQMRNIENQDNEGNIFQVWLSLGKGKLNFSKI